MPLEVTFTRDVMFWAAVYNHGNFEVSNGEAEHDAMRRLEEK